MLIFSPTPNFRFLDPFNFKVITKKPVLTRTGYDAYEFSIKNDEGFLRINFYKLLTKLTLKFSDTYTVTSNADIKFLRSKFKINEIKLVPNWVEVNYSKLKRQSDTILMVGRLEYQKNYQMAIDFLNESKIDVGYRCIWNRFFKEKLESIVSKNNLNINFLGNINHEN